MDKLNIHAIIPARGGSKGIPRKNIIDYKGKPLIAHSIELALKCPLIDKVIVSTDSEEIAEIAKKYGADVPFIRPSKYATDESRDIGFFKHYLKYLENIIMNDTLPSSLELDNKLQNKINNIFPDIIVQLRPTSPNRTLDELTDTIKTFMSSDVYHVYDSLRTVVPVNKSPYKMYRIENHTIKKKKSECLVPLFNEYFDVFKKKHIEEPYNAPRQVLPKCYVHDGYIDIVKTLTIYDKNSVTGDLIYPYVRNIEQDEICDIDTPKDLT